MIEFAAREHFIKICGVTTAHDARAVAELGASSVGLILSDSKRRVSIDTAANIADEIRGTALSTGVVRNETSEYIIHAVTATRVDAVQVHGALSGELLRELRQHPVAIIKALNVADVEFFDFDESSVDAVLIDGPSPGSGEVHSWQAMETRSFCVPVIAAGGLTADNVAEVILNLRPWGVDVATGVEASPGVKDLTRVSNFIRTARHAFSERGLQ